MRTDDRRRQTLALTAEGAAVFRSATRLLHARLGELLGELPPRDAEHLTRLLQRVEHALGGTPPPRRPPRRPPPHPRRP